MASFGIYARQQLYCIIHEQVKTGYAPLSMDSRVTDTKPLSLRAIFLSC